MTVWIDSFLFLLIFINTFFNACHIMRALKPSHFFSCRNLAPDTDISFRF